MKAKELIEALTKLPADTTVYLASDIEGTAFMSLSRLETASSKSVVMFPAVKTHEFYEVYTGKFRKQYPHLAYSTAYTKPLSRKDWEDLLLLPYVRDNFYLWETDSAQALASSACGFKCDYWDERLYRNSIYFIGSMYGGKNRVIKLGRSADGKFCEPDILNEWGRFWTLEGGPERPEEQTHVR